MERLKKLFRDEKGEIAVEYAVLAGLVALAIVTAVTALGTNLGTLYTNISTFVGGIAIPD